MGKVKLMKKKSGFSLKSKILDIHARVAWIVVLNIKDCKKFGLRPGNRLTMCFKGQSIGVAVDVTDTMVMAGQAGIFNDLAERFSIIEGEPIDFFLPGRAESIYAIQKSLRGKELNYREVYNIISDIVSRRLNDISVAFFIASSLFGDVKRKELSYVVRAMAETGKRLKFKGKVVDKHSVGGLCGNETTPIIVPIIASAGLCIPKTCSRAITSASGTADSFEVIAPVIFNSEKLQAIVRKTGGCIVWGAGDVVPSDSRIIEVASQLFIESFEKMASSIMSKKVAMGIKYLVLDIPVNKTAKIRNMTEAKKLEAIFKYLAKKFKIEIRVFINKAKGPIGRGIGPALQIRDDLKVLEQKDDRPLDLENKAVKLAGIILELGGKAKHSKGEAMAGQILKSGKAFTKFKEIVKAQGGDAEVSSKKIQLGKIKLEIRAKKSGKLRSINNLYLSEVCRVLGTPFIKGAGIYLDRQVGEKIRKGEVIFTMYTDTPLRLELAKKALVNKLLYAYE